MIRRARRRLARSLLDRFAEAHAERRAAEARWDFEAVDRATAAECLWLMGALAVWPSDRRPDNGAQGVEEA